MAIKTPYHLSIKELEKKLKTSSKEGLNGHQAKKRLEENGLNKLPEKASRSILSLFIEQFQEFMVLVLMIAVIISGFLGEFVDAIAILAIVILNAVMGFIQEFRAEKSLQALKELSAPSAKVLRGGSIKDIPSKELVVGDIILVEAGDKIPADGRIISSYNLEVDEAALTGESLPIAKEEEKLNKRVEIGDRTNMLHMGTIVTKGRGRAVVTATSLATEMGQIADLLQQSEDKTTPLQKKLKDLGQWIVFICLIACAAVVGLGVIKGEPIYKMFLSGVSLAVAAIPEGLPAIVTLALALGVQRMIKRNAIVRRLPAVETLGCSTVICSDKTGTLTQNKMTVQQLYTNGKAYSFEKENFNKRGIKASLEIGSICNNAELEKEKTFRAKLKDIENNLLNKSRKVIGDPTEGALLLAAEKIGLIKKELEDGFSKRLEIPFDSQRKMMSVLLKRSNKYKLFTKGAPDLLLNKCSHYLEGGEVKKISPTKRKELLKENERMADQALRVLAVGYREIKGRIDKKNLEKYESNLVFVGLIGMIDPPRPEVKKAILRCKKAGIIPKMITGDHKNTAVAIAEGLNLLSSGGKVITGQEMQKISDEVLKKEIDDIVVFARVAPKDKLRIVKLLQENGHIVAMTGDGINDAPAIKEADIGIAMGEQGTDVTQEASSLILADDNFATIVAAIEEGRGIYDNIRKFIRYLLSCNIGEILTMFLSSLLGLPLPLIPIQILWVNLVTDGLPALALGVDPANDDIMERSPRDKDESVFSDGLKWRILGQGILIGLGTLLVFLYGMQVGGSLIKARSMAFTNLVMAQLFFVFSCRSEKESIFSINLLSNIYLLGAVALSFGMHFIVMYLPFCQEIFKTTILNRNEWGIILLVAGGSTGLIEVVQLITNFIKEKMAFVEYEKSLK